MTKKTSLSIVEIKKVERNDANLVITERYVFVKNHDIKKCKEIALKIWREELCQKNKS